jgi:hypothetical protein
VQLGVAPLLIRAYMHLFSNCCRIMLLMRDVPRKLLVQVRPMGEQGLSSRAAAGVPGHHIHRCTERSTSAARRHQQGEVSRPPPPLRCVQLYTVAYVKLNARDVPRRTELVAFLMGCDEPVALLQARFEPISRRICEVRKEAQCGSTKRRLLGSACMHARGRSGGCCIRQCSVLDWVAPLLPPFPHAIANARAAAH